MKWKFNGKYIFLNSLKTTDSIALPDKSWFYCEIRFFLIYAFFGVNFILWKFCPCKWNDKYQVWSHVLHMVHITPAQICTLLLHKCVHCFSSSSLHKLINWSIKAIVVGLMKDILHPDLTDQGACLALWTQEFPEAKGTLNEKLASEITYLQPSGLNPI